MEEHTHQGPTCCEGKEPAFVAPLEIKEPEKAPEVKPQAVQISLKQFKEWRRWNHTVRYDTVVACGHKIKRPPKNNCEECWKAYFVTAEDLDINQDHKALEAKYGKVFIKQLRRYLNNHLITEANVAQTNPEQTV